MLGLCTSAINAAEKYTFSVGRIRGMESVLLKRPHFERLADSPSPERAWEVLCDASPWWRERSDGEQVNTEISLRDRLREAIYEVSSMLPTRPIARIFAIRWDFLSLKSLARRYVFGDIAEPERLEQILEEANFFLPGLAPLDYRASVALLSDALARDAQPHVIDRTLDAEMFHIVLRNLSEDPIPFAHQFFSLRADLLNLEMVLRCRIRNTNRQEVQSWLIPGGTLPEHYFLEAFSSGGGTGVATSLFASFTGTLLEEPLAHLQRIDDESEMGHRLELLVDDHMTEFVHAARYISFGPEPHIGYLHGVEMEVKNVRRVFSGISRCEKSESILTDLRRPYV